VGDLTQRCARSPEQAKHATTCCVDAEEDAIKVVDTLADSELSDDVFLQRNSTEPYDSAQDASGVYNYILNDTQQQRVDFGFWITNRYRHAR